MKEILLGLLALSGFVVTIYILLYFTGVIVIFVSNLFSTTSHIRYTNDNIKSNGGKGLFILCVVLAVLIVAHLIGKIMTS